MGIIATGNQNAVLALAPAVLTVAILGAFVVGVTKLIMSIFEDIC